MTTVIDHAIAIPTRPNSVWQVINDISNLPNWHPDSQRVQYLTTVKSGRGTRWRNTTRSNKEQVFEITAWYEGLGYEYRIVDGSNYPKNRGRIRLQEAPEGTVVQWTFSYEMNGFLSNLRNNLSMKGKADKEIVLGLRNLYILIKEAKADEVLDPVQSKAYLKEAPNVEERASYQPKYPSKVSSQEIPAVKLNEDMRFKPPAETEQAPLAATTAPQIEEPPLTLEDTRPNPVVQAASEVPPVPSLSEPDFLKAMPDPAPVQPEANIEVSPPEESVKTTENVSTGETETAPVSAQDVDVEPVEIEEKAPVKPVAPKQDVSKLDTATVSVFELFGIDKPSETEKVQTMREIPAVEDADVRTPIIEPPRAFMDSTPIIPDVTPEVPARRQGLRAALRSRFTKVRVPRNE